MLLKFGLSNNPVLTSQQVEILKRVFSDQWFANHFYLTGGTALAAFYYQHRLSEDLDFFSHGEDLSLFRNFVTKIFTVAECQHLTGAAFFQRFIIKNVKVDFISDVSFRFGLPEKTDGIAVDHIQNIAVNKVCAIFGRFEPKDYVDLFFILNNESFDIFELLMLAKQKDSGIEPFIWSSLISSADKIQILPVMKTDLKILDIKNFYKNLRSKILKKIKPH